MNLKNDIRKCFDVKGNLSFKKISKDLLNEIIKETSFLDEYNAKPQERIYCILNDIKEIIKCPITNKKLRYSPQNKKYNNSFNYSQKNKVVKNKFNYTEKNKRSSDELKQKYLNSDYSLMSKEECSEFFHKHSTQDNVSFSISRLLKYPNFACSVFYYTSFITLDDFSISERVYCIEHNIQSTPTDDENNHLPFINRKKGYSKYASRKDMHEKQMIAISSQIEEKFEILSFIKDQNTTTTSRVEVKCKQCEHIFKPLFKNKLWSVIYCPNCNGHSGRSREENEVVDFLKTLGIDNIILNDRTMLNGHELDIYLPDHSLAIEYNGILWHSFGTTFPNNAEEELYKKHKHLKKYEQCLERGISLITIFDNEWKLKKDVIKSILSNKLKKTSNKIYARKCKYGEVGLDIAKKFLDVNHRQGSCKFTKAIGLYYNNELVSLMCFGNRKITRGASTYELIRFCNLLNTQVIGGASKILKHSNIKKFISYCDLRYSNGELYKKLNMKLISKSKPNYYYTSDNIVLLHRMNFQKHTLIKTASDKEKTERELMYERGYRRIYDCGNLVFLYDADTF